MKLDERRIADLGRVAARLRVVLVHGDDPVLLAERAKAVLEVLAPAREGRGRFGVTELDGGEHARAMEAMTSPMLGGGAPVVRLREAADSATPSVLSILSGAGAGAGVLLIETAGLPSRSRLRAAVEASEHGAAIMCRGGSGRDLSAGIDRILAEIEVTIDPDARRLLIERSAGYGGTLHEIEKLALLVADGGSIGVADVLVLDEDTQAAVLEALMFASALGRVREADRLTEAMLADGAAPVAVLRVLLGHLARIRAARLAADAGLDVDAAVAALRPIVFFQRVAEMRQTVARLDAAYVEGLCAALWSADRTCRETGMPAAAICRRAIAHLLAAVPQDRAARQAQR